MIDENRIQLIKIEDIIPNRFQPRERFDEESLYDLAKSIKEHGVIQPIIVRKLGDKYELIAGERRTKASSLAGLTTIPAIIREMDDKESAKLSLLENLQRKNLTAIEEAKTYKRILQLDNITQDELARTMGRSQSMVANKLRLLSLPDEIQDALVKNQISERHARSLLTIKNKKDQLLFLDRIKKERLTVRELDKEIKKYKEGNNIEEKEEKENIMNNRSNFGGMGLNDYQSDVGNNMFNNIPNNFNNMATPVGDINQDNNYDYGDFNENKSFDNQSVPVNGNNGMNIGNNESLGSMFDGGMNQANNNMVDNNAGNNLFISQIREDNLPKKENQFLPNFDDDINNNYQNEFAQNNNYTGQDTMSSMNFNSPVNYNENSVNYDTSSNNYMNNNNLINQNNLNQMNSNPYGQNMAMEMNNSMNNFQPLTNQQMNTYNDVNNMSQDQMNGFYANPNYQQNMNQMNNQMPMGNQDIYGNQLNMGQGMSMQQNQQYMQPNNQGYSINSFENYNPYNNQSSSMIPDFGRSGNVYQNPNGGNLFNQPLNIVGPYGPSPIIENPMPTSQAVSMVPPVVEQPVPQQMNIPPASMSMEQTYSEQQEQNQNYNEQPVSMPNETKEENFKPSEIEIEKPIEQASSDEKEDSSEEEVSKDIETSEEKTTPIPDIEVIGDSEIPIPTEDSSEKEQNYIKLDEEISIHNTLDALAELKTVINKIKKSQIDIDTEEIDFDDIYQITIKIKKEEN